MTSALIFGLAALALVIWSAFFSGIETALFSLQPFEINRLRANRPRLAAALGQLLERPRVLLSAILVADAATNLPLIILSLYFLRELLPPILPFWVQALLIFALLVVVCDLMPKMLALRNPFPLAKAGAAMLKRVMPALEPLCRLLERCSETIADWLTPAKFHPRHFLSEEELETLVQLSAEEGALHAAESEIIQEILKLGDKTVKDCMTPRIDMFALPDDLTKEEAIARVKQARHRRVPIYGETPDEILGLLDVKEFLLDSKVHYTEVMGAPSFVPETMKALDLLRNFLTHRQGLAIIIDEFGGTEGIISFSDIVEEILADAVPAGDQELYIERIDEHRLIVNGSARLDDLDEQLGTSLEQEGLDTIGGLIFQRLGYLPRPGTLFRIDNISFRILQTSRKRIEEVEITIGENDGKMDGAK